MNVFFAVNTFIKQKHAVSRCWLWSIFQMYIRDNIFSKWDSNKAYYLSGWVLCPTLQAQHIPEWQSLWQPFCSGPLISVLPQAEQSREGGIQRQFKLTVQITFQTSQTEYLTLLPLDKRYGGFSLTQELNLTSPLRDEATETSYRLALGDGRAPSPPLPAAWR